MIQYQILQHNIIVIIERAVREITIEILEVKGLTNHKKSMADSNESCFWGPGTRKDHQPLLKGDLSLKALVSVSFPSHLPLNQDCTRLVFTFWNYLFFQFEVWLPMIYKSWRVIFLNSLEDLSEPVDVYSDWIDACESANQ